MNLAKTCEIYSIRHRNTLLWKWRYTAANGFMNVCDEEYSRFVECVAAARARGYTPRSDWTGPCALINPRDGRTR